MISRWRATTEGLHKFRKKQGDKEFDYSIVVVVAG